MMKDSPSRCHFSGVVDEQRNSIIFESIIDGFFACDEEWRFVYLNATAERVLGLNRKEVIGKNHWEVYPHTFSTLMKDEYRLAAAGQSRDFEYYCKVRRRWFHNRCFPRTGGGISVYLQDITERKLAEGALVRERNLLQSVMNGAKNSHLVYLDRDFNFVRVNEAYATTCGYRPDEMIGKNHFDLYPHAENEAIFARVRDTGEPFEAHDKPFKFPDQPERGVTYWDWTLSPVKDEAGEISGLIFSLFETTDRKRAEKALKSSERKYRHIFETNNSMMAISALADGRIIDVNGTFCRALGHDRDALIGNTGEEMSLWAIPDDPKRVIDLIQKKGRLDHEEVRVRTKAGEVRVTLLSAVCVNIDEEPCIVTSLIDITERKQFEEKLRALNEELEQRVERRTRELQESQRQVLHAEKLAAIGRLSASIAHEFNSPLQCIMTILKGFQKSLTLEKQDRIFLDLAFNESERMKNLIRSLQGFNRPSSGRKDLMDVHETIDSLLLLSKIDLKRQGVSVIVNYAENLPQIMAIPDQIKQVLLNLMQNAADACNGGKGVITITTCREDKKIAVAIQDNGIGIAADKLTQIFQPFYSTKPEVKGTGLGLSISHGIVQNHLGEIRVESEPGKGSTFTVLLPILGD